MRKALTVTIVIAATLVVYGEKTKPQAGKHEQQASNAISNSSTPMVVINESHSNGESKEHPEKAKSYLSRLFGPENLPNIALVFVAGVTGWFIAKQAVESANAAVAAKDSADAAKRTAEALFNSERAWIDVQLVPECLPPVQYHINITNYGKTPAKMRNYEVYFGCIPEGQGCPNAGGYYLKIMYEDVFSLGKEGFAHETSCFFYCPLAGAGNPERISMYDKHT